MKLQDLEIELRKINLPKRVRLKQGVWIIDVPKFIEVNLSTLKANSGKKVFMPYYKQLLELYNKLKK
jgi:hypothetical protein